MNAHRPQRLAFAILSALIATIATGGRADAQTWVGGTNVWDTTTNWSPQTVPGVGGTATFSGTGNGSTTIDLGGVTRDLLSLVFDTSSAASYTFSGGVGNQFNFGDGGSITINTGVTTAQTINANIFTNGAFSIANNGTGILTLGGSLTLNTGTAPILQLSGSGTTTISGNIGTGISGINKTGNGTLILSGNNSAFTGSIIAAAPTGATAVIRALSNNAFGSGSPTSVSISSISSSGAGAFLDLQAGVVIPSSVTLFLNSATARVAIQSTATTAQVTAGDVVNNTWNGPIIIQGAPALAQFYTTTNGTFTVNGTITAETPTYNGQIALRGSTATAIGVINGIITAPAATILKTEASTWVIGSIGNSFSSTIIANGTLRLGISNGLPVASTLIMGDVGAANSPSAFDLFGFNQSIAGITQGAVSATTTSANSQTITNSQTTLSTLTIQNETNFSYGTVNTATSFLQNRITGNLRVLKAGAGTQTLSGRNTYTGGTTVEAGELVLSGLGTYGTSAFTVTGGLLRFTANQSFSGGVAVSGGEFRIAASNSFTGGVQVTNNGTFTLSATGGFGGGVTVNGANALFTTTALNTVFTGGTTLTNGTIRIGINATTSLGSTANIMTINGGTLDLNGFNQAITNIAGNGGTITNLGATNSVLTLGGSVGTGTYSGTIADGPLATLGISKSSTGTITLAGTHTYTGPTTVNASGGTLRFTSAVPSNSPITVNSAGTLNVATSFANYANTLAVTRGGTFTLSSGTPSTASNLTGITLGDGLATANPSLNFQVGATSDLLALPASSIITLTSVTTINITALSGFGVGTYTLISDVDPTGRLMPNTPASSFVFGAASGVVGSFGYQLLSSPNSIRLQVTAITPTAGPIYWNGSQSASWNTLVNGSAGNFSSDIAGIQPIIGSPNPTTIVHFSANNVLAANTATTLDGSYTIQGLVFNSQTAGGTITAVSIGIGSVSTSSLTITPGSIAGGINVQAGAPAAINITAPVVLGANQTFTVADAGTMLSINGTGSISGAFNLTKTGAGTAVIRLVGTTYTGNTMIAGGTLNLNVTGVSNHDGIISGPGNLVKSGISTLTLGSNNTYTGSTTIIGGTTILPTIANGGLPSSIGASSSASSNFVIGGTTTATIQITGITNTTDRNITLENTTSTTFVLPTDDSILTFNGSFTGSVPTLIFGTTGATGGQTSRFNLSGDSTGFIGNITLNNGAVVIKAASGLGSGTKTIANSTTTTSMSSLQLDGSAAPITLGSDFTFNTSFGGAVNGLPTKAIVNLAGNNTIASNFTMTGDNTFQSNGGTLTLTGTFSHVAAATRSVILDGTSTGTNTFSGTLSESGTSLVGLIKGPGNGTWIVDYNATNTGTTKILGGILRSGRENALPLAALQFGDTATAVNTATGTLDLANFNQTVTTLSIVSNSANANTLIINPGKTLTVNGNVTVGVAPSSTAETRFMATGGGSLTVNNLAANGSFQVGFYTAPSNTGSRATADLSGLSNLTISLDPATGIVRVNPNGATNLDNRFSTLILPSTGAGTSTITANSVIVGDGVQGNGAGMINLLRLGSGVNRLNVNNLNVATGQRDQGQIDFATAAGSLILRDSTGTGRAAINLAAGTGVTGLPANDSIDLRNHNSDLLVSTLAIGTRPRSDTAFSSFFFNQGNLDIDSVSLGFKSQTAESATGPGVPRSTNATLDIGGGVVILNNGFVNFGTLTGSGYTSPTAPHTLNATLNITSGTVTIGASVGVSATLATLTVTGATNAAALASNSTINISGGTVTFLGDIARGVVSGTSSGGIMSTASLNITGGTVDMTGKNIGALDVLTFSGGTLQNLGTLSRGLTQTGSAKLDVAANNTNITGAYAFSSGSVSIANGFTLASNSTTISGGNTLAIGFGSTPTSSGQLSSPTIDLTGVTPGNKLNVPLTVSPDLTGQQSFTLTVLLSGSAGITYAGGTTLDPNAIAPSATNFNVVGPYTITGDASSVRISFTAAPVPEPAALGAFALAGLAAGRMFRRRNVLVQR